MSSIALPIPVTARRFGPGLRGERPASGFSSLSEDDRQQLRLFNMTSELNLIVSANGRPSAYRIFITPNLESASFAGESRSTVDITESTSELKLNAIELDLGAATLTTGGTAHRSIDLNLDEEYEVVTYTFDRRYRSVRPSSRLPSTAS